MLNLKDLNFSINTIKSLCNSQLGCIDCPMNKNCNEFPPNWDEIEENKNETD